MNCILRKKRTALPLQALTLLFVFSFILSSLILPDTLSAQSIKSTVLDLPAPGNMLHFSKEYAPVIIKGLTLDPSNPLEMDFIIDTGETELDGEDFNQEAKKLIQYFLATLTVPEEELWVNLSPYEKDRIIADSFSETIMGRDMLAQDYLLKQLSASVIYPEEELGQKFWDNVYTQAKKYFGSTDIPINTFNKIWIVPDKAVIYTDGQNAFILESYLKVMLEEDYLALKENMGKAELGIKHAEVEEVEKASNVSSNVIREIVLPEIEREINKGRSFAKLRQIYNSMILGAWYKQNLKQSLLGKVYVNQNKVSGVDVKDKQIREKIYNQYLEAFRKGVYDYIRKDQDPLTKKPILRKYYSGGFDSEPLNRAMLSQEIRVPRGTRVSNLPRNFRQRFDRGTAPTHSRARQVRVRAGFMEIGERSYRPYVDHLRDRPVGRPGPSRLVSRDLRNRAMLTYAGVPVTTQIQGRIEELKTAGNVLPRDEFDSKVSTALARTEFKIFSPRVFVVDTESEEEEFGAVVYDKNIYIEKNTLDKLQAAGKADPVTRVLIHLLTEGSVTDKRIAEYEYAKEIAPDVTNNLLPQKGRTIEDVLATVRRDLVALEADPLVLKDEFNIPSEIVAPRTEATYALSNELGDIAKAALYKIATNALNGKINLDGPVRLSRDEPKLTKRDKVRAGMLAFSAHPLTQAHFIGTMLKAMAEAEVDTFFTTITVGDYRKPWLVETYAARERLTKEYVETASGGLIKVMPRLEDDVGLNGEDKVLSILELNKEAGSVELFYGAGGDHYHSFVRYSEGEARVQNEQKTARGVVFTPVSAGDVQFDVIHESGPNENKADYERYVRLQGYRPLLRRLLDVERESMSTEEREFVEKIIANPNPASLLKEGAIFPRLDTIGKLHLIQREADLLYGEDRIRVVMLNTLRQDIEPDSLRDELGFPTVANDWVRTEISSTELRKGFRRLIADGELSLDLLRTIPRDLLRRILAPGNRDYLYALVTLQEPILPKSIQAMMPVNREAEEERQQGILEQARAQIREILPTFILEDYTERDGSFIRVLDPTAADGATRIFEARYAVRHTREGKKVILINEVTRGRNVEEAKFISARNASFQALRSINETADIQQIKDTNAAMLALDEDAVEADLQESPLVTGVERDIAQLINSIPELQSADRSRPLLELEGDNAVGVLRLVSETENRFGISLGDPTARSATLGNFHRIVLTELARPAPEVPELQTLDRARPPGGIDLNPQLLDLQIKRDDNGIPLPVYDQPLETMQIDGFLPVIINVTPVNIPMLMGSVEEDRPVEQLSSL